VTTDCPDEVALVFVVTPACGYLTVPERWEAPNGKTIRIFVARVDPADGVDADDPMVVVGETLGGRPGITTPLSNVSEVTGEREYITLSTTQLRDGSLLYIIGVAPQPEAKTYENAFRRVRQSLQIAD